MVYAPTWPSDNCISIVYVSARECSIQQYRSLVDRLVYYIISRNFRRS